MLRWLANLPAILLLSTAVRCPVPTLSVQCPALLNTDQLVREASRLGLPLLFDGDNKDFDARFRLEDRLGAGSNGVAFGIVELGQTETESLSSILQESASRKSVSAMSATSQKSEQSVPVTSQETVTMMSATSQETVTMVSATSQETEAMASATSPKLAEPLAAKFVRLDTPADRRRLLAALAAHRRLGIDRGQPARLVNASCGVLITRRHRGATLQRALLDLPGRRLSTAAAARLARALLRALRRLHLAGIVHGDLKPENIVVEQPDDLGALALVDFDGTVDAGAGNGRVVVTSTTLAYAAPELRAAWRTGGDVTSAVDVWAVGRVLQEVLAGGGRPPARHEWTPAVGGGGGGGGLADFLARLTRRRPEERPTCAEALRHPWLLAAGRQGSGEVEGR